MIMCRRNISVWLSLSGLKKHKHGTKGYNLKSIGANLAASIVLSSSMTKTDLFRQGGFCFVPSPHGRARISFGDDSTYVLSIGCFGGILYLSGKQS